MEEVHYVTHQTFTAVHGAHFIHQHSSINLFYAAMVELVDTRDLKSLGQ